ncbi:MAG: hypothetical protein Kow00114_33080 [Kiloniellaceae bacterium]
MTADATTEIPPSRPWLLAVATVLAAALAARLLFLGDKALWLDEAYSVWFSAQSWHSLWQEVPRFETHPPLYYSVLKLWRFFGSGEGTLRALSVLASVAAVLLVMLAGYIAAPRPCKLPMAAGAGLFFATSALQLDYAQQARPYALLALAMSLTLAAAVWLVAHPERAAQSLLGPGRRDRAVPAAYLCLAIGVALMLWMHNLGGVFAAALAGVLSFWWTAQAGRRRPLLLNLLGAALLAFAFYAPNLPNLASQVQTVAAQFWLEAPSLTGAALLMAQVYGQWQAPIGNSPLQLIIQGVIGLPIALLGIAGLWRLFATVPERRWIAWLLLGTAFGPTLAMLALTYTVRPVLLDRTLLPAQVPWALICAAAPFALPRLPARTIWGAVVAICLLNAAGFIADQATAARRDAERPWRAIAQRIAASDAAGAPVVVVPNSGALPLGYYDAALGTILAIHPLPAAYPARGDSYRYPAGGQGVPGIDDTVLPLLAEATAEASTVWLITRLEPLFDPQLIVRQALAARFPCAKQTTYGLIAVTRFDGADHCG